jgi:hypothetical protein
MKQLIFFLFFTFCLSTSCTNKNQGNVTPASPTLKQRFPQWTNLSWVSTDEDTDTYPRLNLSISENAVIIRQDTSVNGYISGSFNDIYILGNMVTFMGDRPNHNLTAYFSQTDSTLLIKTRGLLINDPENTHIYLLLKDKQPE